MATLPVLVGGSLAVLGVWLADRLRFEARVGVVEVMVDIQWACGSMHLPAWRWCLGMPVQGIGYGMQLTSCGDVGLIDVRHVVTLCMW